MKESERLDLYRKTLRVLFLITFIIFIPPAAIYAWARFNGSLPSEAEWDKLGGNHGPWWDEPQALLVLLSFLAMFALPLVTFLFAAAMSFVVKNHRLVTFGKGMALSIFQFVIGYATLALIFWTVD